MDNGAIRRGRHSNRMNNSWRSICGVLGALFGIASLSCASSGSVGDDGKGGGGAASGGAAGQGGAGGTGGFPLAPPKVSVLDAHPVLKDTKAEVYIVMSSTWAEPITVDFSTLDDTAKGDSTGSGDFKPVTRAVTIPAGQLKMLVEVEVNTPYKKLTLDTALSKRFKTKIENPTGGATVDDGDGVVTLAQAGMVVETPLASKLWDCDVIPDFNGDKKPDLILTGQTATAAVLVTPGTVFEEAGHAVVDTAYLDGTRAFGFETHGIGTANASAGVAIVGDHGAATDINGDGLSDVLIVGEHKAHFLYGHAGPFKNFVSADPRLSDGVEGTELSDIYFGYGGSQIQTGDWDNDGIFDWAQASYYSSVHPGSRDLFAGFYGEKGPFSGTHASTTNFSYLSGTTAVGQSALFSGSHAGSRLDLNGDGIDDISFVGLSANDGQFGGNYMYVRFGTKDRLTGANTSLKGTLDGVNGFQITNDAYMSYASAPWNTSFGLQDSGDLNGDGVEDLVVTNGGNPLTAIFGKKSSFAMGSYPKLLDMGSEAAFFKSDQVKSARIGDLNKDGLGDIVFITEDKLRVVWGKKDLKGQEIFGTKYPDVGELDIESASGLDTVALIADMDGDKTDDVVILSDTWNSDTGAALVLFGSTLTRFLGGPNLDPQIPR